MATTHEPPPIQRDEPTGISPPERHHVLFGWQSNGIYWLLALLVLGPLLLIATNFYSPLNERIFALAVAHLVITGIGALLGIILSLLVLRVAHRASDGRSFMIGLALLSTALIFLVHSISTPNIIFFGLAPSTTRYTAQMSLVLGSIFFALSGLELTPQLNQRLMRHTRVVLGLVLAFWILFSWSNLSPQQNSAPVEAHNHTEQQAAPDQSGPVAVAANTPATTPSSPFTFNQVLVLFSLACYAFAIWRHYALYRRSPSDIGLAFTCGIILFGQALISQQLSQTYTASFWLYHVQEFAGFGVITSAVFIAYQRGQAGEGLLESLFLPGTRARIQANYANALDALIETLARGEQPTHHLRQTLRGRFGLTESQVQALERAAAAVAQERQQREELERLYSAMRQLERDKEQVTQMVVHDLKNPLTALVGFLEMLRHGQLSAEQQHLVESALRSGKNLSGLIADLLDVAQSDEGRLELNRSTFIVHDLLVECTAEMHAWLSQESKTIKIEVCEPIALNADVRLMRRLLLNLISNAIKHTNPGTSIVLRVLPGNESGWCTLEVIDDGPGIASMHLERIFERFGRVNGEQPMRQHSTGLGLAFCRMVVNAHDGTITATSTIGQGTTFHIQLPHAQIIQPELQPAPAL